MRNVRMCKRRALHKAVLCLVFFLLFCSIGVFAGTKFLIEPNLENVAAMRAEAVVSRTINRALADQFSETEKYDELFTVRKDENGAVKMVQADSLKINLLMADLSVTLQEYFKNMETERYEVPFGSLLGSKMFSQMGPYIEVKIIPMSISSMDFRTEFESQGINQTKYKIYIELDCRIRALAPFSSNVFNSTSTILIAETVILGDVPNSYVEVPKEDILDVIEE